MVDPEDYEKAYSELYITHQQLISDYCELQRKFKNHRLINLIVSVTLTIFWVIMLLWNLGVFK